MKKPSDQHLSSFAAQYAKVKEAHPQHIDILPHLKARGFLTLIAESKKNLFAGPFVARYVDNQE